MELLWDTFRTIQGYVSTVAVYHLGITIFIVDSSCGVFDWKPCFFAWHFDACGPLSDNAGGISEISQIVESVKERTDFLDIARKTIAEIRKVFSRRVS